MNGARSTFMRTGYWLTALAAAVLLLAASPGTVSAQVQNVEIDIDVPKTVGEGGTATIEVTAKGLVAGGTNTSGRTIVVTVALDTANNDFTAESGEPNQVADAGFVTTRAVRLVLPENPGTGSTARSRTARGTAIVQTNNDADAEDEEVVFMLDTVASGATGVTVGVDGSGDADNRTVVEGTLPATDVATPQVDTAYVEWTRKELEIGDKETQNYTLSLNSTAHRDDPPRRGTKSPLTSSCACARGRYRNASTACRRCERQGGEGVRC